MTDASMNDVGPPVFIQIEGTCELLGEFGAFGWWLQGLLGVLSFGSLLAKRWRERPRRTWKVFIFDCAKQASGGFFIHLLNLGGAGLMAAMFKQDVCVWYWINIIVDTTLGVYVQYVFLRAARRFLKGAACLDYGEYGNPPRWSSCFTQALSWQAFCLLMKLSASIFMIAFQGPLGLLWMRIQTPNCRDIPIYNVVQTTEEDVPTSCSRRE
ncbi:hypothetical protein cyc_04730 [Cyclospora cayetanensis]|uniref:Transmembrane protein n=1 Tax=Cyclospora cayetanensis TaxID=88456 RepID=A0A1D3D535_9EIME|nr:hypothetical protein cyc_04730 [Cyclospora cayetanensis]